MEENTSKVFVGRNNAALADPLLAPVTPSAPASSLFVINLCASIAPVQTAGKTIPGFETYKLYQVARAEDGRTRHRLRLGFFTSEEDAERVLASVRDNYPTAFVTCLSDDDRRFARGFLPDTESTASWKRPVIVPEKPAAPKPAVVKVAAAPAPAPVAPITVSPAASSPAKAATPAPAKKPAVEVARQPEPKPASKAAAPAPKAPAPADDITAIELSWDPPALEAPKPANASAPAQTVPAVFKTETVIKASPPPAPKPESRAPQTSRLAAPATSAPLTLAKEPEPAPAAPAPAAAPSGPFHVGKGIDIPAVGLSLEATTIQPPVAPKAPAPTVEKKAAAVAKEPAQKPAAPASKSKAEPAPIAAPAVPARAAA
ncbi:MAG TPA: SPOR domain-containing protein, partial [Burkholderiales bacterium]|nr:SPOR domain-containing protein [Burkholderiales bacterium]